MNTLAAYCHEQGLSRWKFTFDDFFASVFQRRKRGDGFDFELHINDDANSSRFAC
jgi:hypothetical protein